MSFMKIWIVATPFGGELPFRSSRKVRRIAEQLSNRISYPTTSGIVETAAQLRESRRLSNCGARDAGRIIDSAVDELGAQADELIMYGAPCGRRGPQNPSLD